MQKCIGYATSFVRGLPWWLSGIESACQCRRHRFNSWVRNISWTRKWQLTPVFLPGKSHGQRNLVDHSSWGHKESDMTKWLITHALWIARFRWPLWSLSGFLSFSLHVEQQWLLFCGFVGTRDDCSPGTPRELLLVLITIISWTLKYLMFLSIYFSLNTGQ